MARSDHQVAATTWWKSFGHHLLTGFVDHGSDGTGEQVAALLRPGNAGSDSATDHITATRLALPQFLKRHRCGRSARVRSDPVGGAHEFLACLTKRDRWLSYSVGMTITEQIHQAVSLPFALRAKCHGLPPRGDRSPRQSAAHRFSTWDWAATPSFRRARLPGHCPDGHRRSARCPCRALPSALAFHS